MLAHAQFRRFVVALAAACAFSPAHAQVARDTTPVHVIFFDVGQGDAALIVSPTGRKTLIDAGPAGAHIAGRLRKMGVDTLDLVIASHNHADHVGGMAAVLESVVVRRYIDNGLPTTTQTYARIVTALERHSIEVLQPAARRIGIGGGAELRVLPSSKAAETQNDRSIGVVLTYGQSSALFTGDAQALQRNYWMSSGALGAAQLLKVSHHGSSNGTDRRFLKTVRACAAVVSVGDPNAFGHPSASVVALLRTSGVRVYRTDRDGEISATLTRDGRLEMETTKGSEQPCVHPAR